MAWTLEEELGHHLLQVPPVMVTGKPWRQGHHSLAGEAVHSSELVHHVSIPQSHLLAVHLHQRSGAVHHQLPGSSQPRVAPPDGLAGLYCLSEYPTRLETAYHPIYALGREGSAFLGPQCPQLLPSPAGVLLPDGPDPLYHLHQRLRLSHPLGSPTPRLQPSHSTGVVGAYPPAYGVRTVPKVTGCQPHFPFMHAPQTIALLSIGAWLPSRAPPGAVPISPLPAVWPHIHSS